VELGELKDSELEKRSRRTTFHAKNLVWSC